MKARCKLELNMQALEKNALKKEPLRVTLIQTKCLECGIEFQTDAEKKKIFCSGACADLYNKHRRGLV